MEVLSQKSHNAGPSNRWSLDSNQYRSGRFAKVSIGITVEKCPRLDSGIKNDDAISLLTSEKRPASHERLVQGNLEPATVESNKAKLTAKNQRGSTKLSTKLFCTETATTETVHAFAQQVPVAHLGGILNKVSFPSEVEQSGKIEKASALSSMKSMTREAVQVIANQGPLIGRQVGLHKKVDTIVSDKELEKGINVEKQDVVFTTAQEVHVPDKSLTREKPDGATKLNSEFLRMKLWEILGNGSQNKQVICSPDLVSKRSSNGDEKGEAKKGKVTKAKQNSDTIETDSDSPNQTVRKPITRSVTRKKAPIKIVNKMPPTTSNGKMPLASSSTASRLKPEDKNIFTFDEEEVKAVRSGQFCSGLSNNVKGKRSKQIKGRIEPRRIHFSRKSTSYKDFQTTEKEEIVPLHNKASPKSQETGYSPLTFQLEKSNLETPNEVSKVSRHIQKEEDKNLLSPPVAHNQDAPKFSGSLGRKLHSSDYSESPAQNGAYLQKEVDSPSVAKSATPFVEFESPTFAPNPTKPSTESKLLDEYFSPVVSQKRISTRRACMSKFMEDSTAIRYCENANVESSEETRDINELLDTSPCGVEEKETKTPSPNPSEQQKYESFEAGYRSPRKCLYDGGNLMESPFRSCRKRVHNFKDNIVSQSNMSIPLPDDTARTEETSGVHEMLDQFPKDSLARAVCQLAIFVKRFRNKMKSRTGKKSSEILSDAAEKIRQQIQDVKSQIDKDLGKFISFDKSKRRRLESKFQEQSEMLRVMHDKFKEELNKHLLNCSSTLEEIETQNIELKGCADRQQASHRKLLLQVKEAIESQLYDAETRIAALQKEASRKMDGLRHVLREWMMEDTNLSSSYSK